MPNDFVDLVELHRLYWDVSCFISNEIKFSIRSILDWVLNIGFTIRVFSDPDRRFESSKSLPVNDMDCVYHLGHQKCTFDYSES